MNESIKKLEKKAANSKAVPAYLRDLIMREIVEGKATEEWAGRMCLRISFLEQFTEHESLNA